MKIITHLPCYFIALLLLSCASTPQPESNQNEKKTVEEVIPLTSANIRGHSSLYHEGWYVITSTDKALDYAYDKSVVSSRAAATAAAHTIANRNQTYAADIQNSWQLGKDVTVDTYQTGRRLTRNIINTTTSISKKQVDYGQEQFRKSWQTFVKGNLYLGTRTQDTREKLINQPGNYYDNLSNDFSNIYSLTEKMRSDYSRGIGNTWDNAFAEAKQGFNEEYEQSGLQKNSLMALGDIFQGYAKGLYRGLIRPGATSVSKTVVAGGETAAQIVFLPAATAISVSGRTIQAVGTTVYYTGKFGVEIISPTVEAGLLSGMAILSLGTAPLTYVTGTSIGAVNQVAFTTASPIAGTTTGAVSAAADTGKYVAFVSYDAIAGVSKVTINQASSAVVLGYNALTALPAHVFMGAVDSAVFLAYDGPRLVIAYAKGEIKTKDGQSVRVDSLPTGSVVNLQELHAAGVETGILSEDPEVINQVLEQLPNDLRE